MPPRNVPFPPMEAELVDELPDGDWQYEPKWDGFRGVLENDGGELALWSRNGRPLLRYFPELAEVGDLLPPHSALDGEIVIARDGRLDFDAMQMRLHPAESRVRKLSAEIPAAVRRLRRPALEGRAGARAAAREAARASSSSKAKTLPHLARRRDDPKQAARWLDRLEAAGLDGVIAKRLGLPYLPGSRDGVVKVKAYKTADCVVVGFRWSEKADGRISTLLLGLYGDDGELDFVGHCSRLPGRVRRELEEALPKMLRARARSATSASPAARTAGRRGKELDGVRVRPELVVEVRYDKVQGNRFRHGTKLPALPPRQGSRRSARGARCGRRAKRGDPTVESLLAGS